VNKTIVATVLVLLGALGQSPCFAESAGGISPESAELKMTIQRFFAGESGYQNGDLITRSQVEELQKYLRRTRRRGPALHPTLLGRILPDNRRLVNLFYARSSGEVLRVAAEKLGGYAALEALTRSTASYTQLVEAVDSESVDSVVKLAESAQKADTAKAEGKKKRRKKAIYTADDFFSAVLAASEAKTATIRQENSRDLTGE